MSRFGISANTLSSDTNNALAQAVRKLPSNCLHKVQDILRVDQEWVMFNKYTLQGTNISPQNCILKMIFLFPRWDMLISWSVFGTYLKKNNYSLCDDFE